MKHSPTPDLTDVASAIGQPTRLAMLDALLGNRWLTATELGRWAGVAPATASEHLARLVDAGLVARRRSGRHCYHALAGPEVAAALEALGRIAAVRTGAARAEDSDRLRFARTCYDHLAGTLSVRLTDALVERGYVTDGGTAVSEGGAAWLAGLGIDVDELRQRRRVFIRFCLDWSERRDHLGGAVGAALAETFLGRGWLVRLEGTRAVRLTVRGRDRIYQLVGRDLALAGRPDE